MVSKGARRRIKQKQRELREDIDTFLHERNKTRSEFTSLSTTPDLFSTETKGNEQQRPPTVSTISLPIVQNRSTLKAISKTGGIRKRVNRKLKKTRRAQKEEAFFDIWSDAANEQLDKRHPNAPKNRKEDRVPKLGKGPKPNIPAIVVDSSGCSINPDPVHYEVETPSCSLNKRPPQEIVRKKTIHEQMKVKEPIVKTEKDIYNQESLVEEMKQFLIKESASDDSNDDTPKPVHRLKIPERKTKAQRNKEKRRKQLLKQIDEQKRIKKIHSDIKNLKVIDRTITKQYNRRQLKIAQRRVAKIKKRVQSFKKLHGKVIKDTPIQTVSKNAGMGFCLRKLKASNDLALHRYASFQKRGLIETGRFRGRKNAIRYNYSLPGGRERRIEEAKKEIPLLQQKIQDLHNQLQNVKLSEAT